MRIPMAAAILPLAVFATATLPGTAAAQNDEFCAGFVAGWRGERGNSLGAPPPCPPKTFGNPSLSDFERGLRAGYEAGARKSHLYNPIRPPAHVGGSRGVHVAPPLLDFGSISSAPSRMREEEREERRLKILEEEHEMRMKALEAEVERNEWERARAEQDAASSAAGQAFDAATSAAVRRFEDENPWYGQNTVMTDFARAESDRIAQAMPQLDAASHLRKVKERVEEEFPDYFAAALDCAEWSQIYEAGPIRDGSEAACSAASLERNEQGLWRYRLPPILEFIPDFEQQPLEDRQYIWLAYFTIGMALNYHLLDSAKQEDYCRIWGEQEEYSLVPKALCRE